MKILLFARTHIKAYRRRTVTSLYLLSQSLAFFQRVVRGVFQDELAGRPAALGGPGVRAGGRDVPEGPPLLPGPVPGRPGAAAERGEAHRAAQSRHDAGLLLPGGDHGS